jgi:hypothetical protein
MGTYHGLVFMTYIEVVVFDDFIFGASLSITLEISST